MNTLDLKCFCAAAEELNITHAAERLHLSQQALSSKIARLERDYGARFFDRVPKLRLTSAGARFLNYARDAIVREERIAAELAADNDDLGGLIAFGITPSRAHTTLPHILPPFLDANPKVRVKLEIRSSAQLVKKLLDGDIDLIFCLDQNDFSSDIERSPIMTDELELAIPRSFFARYGEMRLLEDKPSPEELLRRAVRTGFLARIPYVLSGPYARRIALKFLRQYVDAPRVILELYQTETIFSLSMSCLGAGFVFKSFASQPSFIYPKREEFVMLPLDIPEAQCHLIAGVRRKRPVPPLVRAFIDLAQNELNRSEANTEMG